MARERAYELFNEMVQVHRSMMELKREAPDKPDDHYRKLMDEKERRLEHLEGVFRSTA